MAGLWEWREAYTPLPSCLSTSEGKCKPDTSHKAHVDTPMAPSGVPGTLSQAEGRKTSVGRRTHSGAAVARGTW